MTTPSVRPSVQPGEPAPDFTLPAAHAKGTVSLSEYRGRSPVLLALFRGVYWHFCRRHVVLLGITAEKLAKEGVHTLGVVASSPDRARLFFRYRPPRIPVGADPDLATHQAYGLPNSAFTPEIWQTAQAAAVPLVRELAQVELPPAEAYERLGQLDGFEVTERDQADLQRHQAQFTGQFLIDREGIVRWANVECAQEGLAGLDQMPSDEEFLAAARAL